MADNDKDQDVTQADQGDGEQGDFVPKRTVTLEDGTEVVVSLNALTWPEIRSYLRKPTNAPGDPDRARKEEERYAAMIGKAAGMSMEAALALGTWDFFKLDKALNKLVTDGVRADPS